MILRQSWLNVTDGTNIIWTKSFHLYTGWKRKWTTISYFIRSSARVTKPPIKIYKGFKKKFYRKGNVIRGLIVRTANRVKRFDGSTSKFRENAQVIIRFKATLKSKYFYGLISKQLRRKKFLSLFPKVIY